MTKPIQAKAFECVNIALWKHGKPIVPGLADITEGGELIFTVLASSWSRAIESLTEEEIKEICGGKK